MYMCSSTYVHFFPNEAETSWARLPPLHLSPDTLVASSLHTNEHRTITIRDVVYEVFHYDLFVHLETSNYYLLALSLGSFGCRCRVSCL